MAGPLIKLDSVPYHRIEWITGPLTFGIRQDAMLLSPVATDIRFCNLTLYNGLVGLGLNKILQHKEMMFRAPRGLGSSQRSERSGTSEISESSISLCPAFPDVSKDTARWSSAFDVASKIFQSIHLHNLHSNRCFWFFCLCFLFFA